MYGFPSAFQLYGYMLFQAQGLLTNEKGQSNITFLIDAANEDTVRDVCNKHSIAVFSLSQYTQTPDTFGKVFFRFTEGGDTFTIYTQYEKVKDAYSYFKDSGFPISYINNSEHLLSDSDVERVLQKLSNDYKAAHEKTDNPKKNYFQEFTSIVLKKTHHELEDVKDLATHAVDEAEIILQKVQGTQANLLIKIKNAEDELKKIKLGTNIPKIRERIGDLYKVMEEAELGYLESQKEHEVHIAEGSIVTYLDIVAEWEKYKKARNVQKAKSLKTGADTYYTLFGALGLYQRFLGKDMQNKFKNIILIIDGLYNVLVMFIMMTMIWLILFQLINTVLYKGTFFTTDFINIGLMGICSAVLMKLKKPDLVRLIAIGPLCIGLYFLLHSIIYANFGL